MITPRFRHVLPGIFLVVVVLTACSSEAANSFAASAPDNSLTASPSATAAAHGQRLPVPTDDLRAARLGFAGSTDHGGFWSRHYAS